MRLPQNWTYAFLYFCVSSLYKPKVVKRKARQTIVVYFGRFAADVKKNAWNNSKTRYSSDTKSCVHPQRIARVTVTCMKKKHDSSTAQCTLKLNENCNIRHQKTVLFFLRFSLKKLFNSTRSLSSAPCNRFGALIHGDSMIREWWPYTEGRFSERGWRRYNLIPLLKNAPWQPRRCSCLVDCSSRLTLSQKWSDANKHSIQRSKTTCTATAC